MSRYSRHPERHQVGKAGWLRAAVLGANDGIVSTASLIVGVAAASASTEAILVAGVAALACHAPATATALVEQFDVLAGRVQRLGGGEPCDAGANDGDGCVHGYLVSAECFTG